MADETRRPSEPRVNVFEGKKTERRRRDHFLGDTFTVVRVAGRVAPQLWDLVRVDDSVMYFVRDEHQSYLTDEALLATPTGDVVETISPPIHPPLRKLGRRRSNNLFPGTPIYLADHVVPRGRVPRGASRSDKRITIRVTPQEFEAWQRAAGRDPLGEWIRRACTQTLSNREHHLAQRVEVARRALLAIEHDSSLPHATRSRARSVLRVLAT